MGPYYQNTAQSTGAFFNMFYEQPLMMGFFSIVTIGAAVYLWLRFVKNKKVD